MINLLKNKWSCTKLIGEGGGGQGGSKNRSLGQTRALRPRDRLSYDTLFYLELG